MTSFGWKRKAGASVIHKTSQAFEKEAKDDCDNEEACSEVDWLTLTPKRRLVSLEDAKAKSQRLSDEAAMLAEAERYWEAIKKWDESLLLSPCNSRMLEMKTQALMAVGEVFPAVQTAQQTVKADPLWWVAWQTLGRAQLNLGEVGLAIRSFGKAVLLNPVDRELWEDDLQWACSVRDRSKHVAESKRRESKCDEVFRSSTSIAGRLSACSADPSGSDLDEKCAATHANNRTISCKDGERDDIGASRDCDDVEVKQTVLNVPSDYVHLRG